MKRRFVQPHRIIWSGLSPRHMRPYQHAKDRRVVWDADPYPWMSAYGRMPKPEMYFGDEEAA